MFFFELIVRISEALGAEYDERESRFLAREVVKRSSGFSATKLALLNREVVPQKVLEQANVLQARLLAGEPWQYITGEAEFCGHLFSVGPGVLIPRPETEMLVEEALKYGDSLGRPVRVLDACTGSGCIAHSIALARPNWYLSGFDVSLEALKYAHLNGEKLSSKARLFQTDLFGPLEAICTPNSIDILVSNPPYIPVSEKDSLAKQVRDFEPDLALFAAEGDAFIFYKALRDVAAYALAPSGILLAEVHAPLVAETVRIFNDWSCTVLGDIFERPRVIRIEPLV